MKKQSGKNSSRILGRRLARELPHDELKRLVGGVWTYTLLYPSDPGGPSWDGPEIGPKEPILA